MASEANIDIANLLEPISGNHATGEDLRADPSPTSNYQRIRSERAMARSAERQAVHDGDTSKADEHWRNILNLAPEILKNESKDLEVASWFIEAMLRRNGFSGLRDTFLLVEGLIDRFWDDLYPMPDDYGIETRIACMAGLNGEGAEGALIAPLRKVNITQGNDPGPFSLWQYKQILEAQKGSDEDIKQRKLSSLGFSMDDLDKAVEESSSEFFVHQRDDLQTAIDTYRRVGALLDQHCGIHDAPSTKTIIETLDECLGVVNHIGVHKFPADDIEDMTDDSDNQSENQEHSGGSSTVSAQGPIKSREAAFQKLLEISEYFRKTEPHSPVPYILQRAVKWGNMPLEQLIYELIDDESSLTRYRELTGIAKNSEE